ncbi:hypothetical protein B1B_13324, partial [mine drainage metagenome]
MHIKNTLIGAALIAALAIPVAASAATSYTLDVNLASYHTERWARHSLNQRNLGLGVTARFSPDWSISGGWYRN